MSDKNNGWGSMYNTSHGLGQKQPEQPKQKPKSMLDKILNSVGLETKKD